MFVQLAFVDLLGRLLDQVGDFLRHVPKLAVGVGGGPLDQAEGANDAGLDRLAGDGEVEDGALGRGAVEGAGGHGHLAHGVFFGAGV